MARRNPMNPRYQKNTAPAGKTRKSAAAAKPSRAGGSTSGKSSSAKGSSAKKPSPSVFATPDTPEYRSWRRTWWITVVSALVLTALSFALLSFWHLKSASNVVLGLAYGAIFATLYIDWTKIRPMRKAAYQAAKSGKPMKPAEKPAKAEKSPGQGAASDNELAEKSAGSESTSHTDGKA